MPEMRISNLFTADMGEPGSTANQVHLYLPADQTHKQKDGGVMGVNDKLEELLTEPRYLPETLAKILNKSVQTIHNWREIGRIKNGKRVFLKMHWDGQFFVWRGDIIRFFDEING